MNKSKLLTIIIGVLLPFFGTAQVNEDKIGAWYMYFFNTTFKQEGSWGIQGDVQYRNWNIAGDLEQLLVRGGLTYKPKGADIKFTLGYATITTGNYGPDHSTTAENRIYQEALFPVKFQKRFFTNHRFRYEQRLNENQDFRTRYRYSLSLNISLNNPEMDKGTVYLASYNEIFINGQRNIGKGNRVEIFDRNRFYLGVGYLIKKGLQVQLGMMNQTTDKWSKNQLQVSMHHKI